MADTRREKNRIGFVSTRLAGTDGVSLETAKWVHVLGKLGCECFYFAGECDWPEDRSHIVPEAHFNHPIISLLSVDLFNDFVRAPETSQKVQEVKDLLKGHLYHFRQKFNLDLLIVENALAIPMNIPLGLAITEFTAETNMPVIGHHHDFSWERDRFSVSAADDYLRAAFPPTLRSVRHVVINTFGSRQLAFRTGAGSITLIPNVIDFDTPPTEPDEYSSTLRAELGISPDEYLILQPTRIVPRKRIEQSINLTRRLNLPAVLLISHAAGDEGSNYADYLRDYAEAMNIRVLFAGDRFNHIRQQTPDGRKIFSLADAYQQADLVTYPSSVEGFGNAFLEAIYYRRPIVMSSYEIFKADILPKGFKVVSFEDFVTDETVRKAHEVLENPALTAEMVTHNYEVASRYYSYQVLEEHLTALLSDSLGTE